MQTPNAYYRIGFSGTPLARGDRRSVLAVAALGPVIYRLRADRLIEAGVLAKPHIRMLPLEQQSQCPTWQGVYGECIVRSTKRNRMLVAMAKRAARPCLVFVKEIAHGKRLLKLLQAVGVPSEFTWGSDPHERRVAAIKRLERGDIDVLVCSVIFQEGVDIPALASVVIGSGGKSVIATLQRIGRGMRTDQGRKVEFEVWDLLDRGCRMLEKHAKARQAAYLAEGHEVVTDDLLARQLLVGTP
jgi:superfamily II DNA or RNA helicase